MYVTVLSSALVRPLVSMVFEDGQYFKQGDYENAFCQPKLPEDELCIVKPLLECPNLKNGTYWK